MTPRRDSAALRLQICRWCSVAAMSVLGTVVASLLLLFLRTVLDDIASIMSTVGYEALFVLCVIIGMLIWVPQADGRSTACLGARYFVQHPPLWLAILGSLMLLLSVNFCILIPTSDMSPYRGTMTQFYVNDCANLVGAVAISFIMTLGYCGVKGGWLTVSARDRPVDRRAEVSNIDAWLDADDSPIVHPAQDMFDTLDPLARRIARRVMVPTLRVRSDPTFIVIGPRGSGKTSLFHLVSYYLNHPDRLAGGHAGASGVSSSVLRIAHISAWKYADTQSLLRGVLRAVVETVHSEVDAYSLSGLPQAYVTAVSVAGGWFASLSALFAPATSDPGELVKRIGRVLIGTNVRVLLWIDDLERFGDDSEPLDALWWLLRDCPQVSVVLAIANDTQ